MPIDKNGQVWPHTDLDLNTSAALPSCPVDEGMYPNTLSPATKAALTKGFQTDTPQDSGGPCNSDGSPVTVTEFSGGEATPTPGDPLTGFLGRTTLLIER